jgi:hypothetical protein
VEIPPPAPSQRFVSRSFFIPKSSGGFRLVLDFKFLNSHFHVEKVKYESLATLQQAPRAVQVGISIDISDAYHHLAVHEDL